MFHYILLGAIISWDFLYYRFAGIETWQYLAALASLLAGFILNRITRAILGALERKANRLEKHFTYRLTIGTIAKPLPFLFVILGITIALDYLPLPRKPVNFAHFAEAFTDALYVTLIVWAVIRLVDCLMRMWSERATKTESKIDDQVVHIARKTLKVFVFVIGVVIIIQRLGYSAESIIAGLGLGSLALALAAKDTVANLFGSLVIFIDRPFQMGDWVEIGSNEGVIEEINLRTTRLRTFTNSLITIPNQQLTTQAIVNWSAMRKRRVKLVLPLSRHSHVRQIRDVLVAIRQLLATDPDVLQDLTLVHLSTIDEKSFGVLIYCHSKRVKWVEFMAHQERLLLSVLEKLEEMGLEVGMPSTEVRLLPEKTTS